MYCETFCEATLTYYELLNVELGQQQKNRHWVVRVFVSFGFIFGI